MEDPLGPIRAGFFLECDELLGALDDALADAAFSGDPNARTGDETAVHAAFRAVHSIKGGAASLGFGDLASAAHRFETSLSARRDGQAAAARLPRHLWQGAADHLAAAVAAARTGTAPPPDRDTLAQALAAGNGGPEAADAHGPTPPPSAPAPNRQVHFAPDAAFEARGAHPLPPLRALAELGGTGLTCDLSALPALDSIGPDTAALAWRLTLPGALSDAEILDPFTILGAEDSVRIERLTATDPAPAQDLTAGAAPPTAPANPTIRVDLARVDRLLNLAGELLIGQSLLATRLAEAGLSRSSAARDALDQIAATSRILQESVVALRSEPIKPLFQRMGRILREAARATGKDVLLTIEGEMTEVDRSVIERLADPLTHLIRNAVDHGIEPPDLRRARAKPPQGQVTLSAAHRAGRVVIEVADDGGGIDRARILARGAALGLLAPYGDGPRPTHRPHPTGQPTATSRAAGADDTAVGHSADRPFAPADELTADHLLFQPGLSTATEVTELSGRGVGLDVVRTALAAIGGRVSVTSRDGQGTRFTLSLPLTLSVLDVLLVRVAGQTFALPQSAVLETRLVEMLRAVPLSDAAPAGPGMLVPMYGRHVPLWRASDLLPLRGPAQPEEAAHPVAILLSDEEDRRMALSVDAILDQTQVVMKGLGAALAPQTGIAAATILSDGQVALILDPPGLIALAAAQPARSAA